jgi:hypothetical protein
VSGRARRPLESGNELHDDDRLTEQNYDEALRPPPRFRNRGAAVFIGALEDAWGSGNDHRAAGSVLKARTMAATVRSASDRAVAVTGEVMALFWGS